MQKMLFTAYERYQTPEKTLLSNLPSTLSSSTHLIFHDRCQGSNYHYDRSFFSYTTQSLSKTMGKQAKHRLFPKPVGARQTHRVPLQMRSTTSQSVINTLKSVFARHGIPETLRSDNGPQFTSREFADFAENYQFRHTMSSPHYQS